LPQQPEFQTGIGVRIAAHSKKAIAPFITTTFKQQSQKPALPARRGWRVRTAHPAVCPAHRSCRAGANRLLKLENPEDSTSASEI
jgi:hypothetical protein